MSFRKTDCSSLQQIISEVRSTEQTQELRLPDDLPDVGKIVGSWAQVVIRGKEWRTDSVLLTGGVMVRVLYAPEEGDKPCTIPCWIPFQIKWDLPEHTPEGKLISYAMPRYVDTRIISPRKIMIRCGIGALGRILIPAHAEILCPQSDTSAVQLLRRTVSVRMPRQAGEKVFSVEEHFHFSTADLPAESIVRSSVSASITDQKVMSNKIVFRGSCIAHLLGKDQDGNLHTHDVQIPFSQFADLEETCSAEAHVQIVPMLTELELEDENGEIAIHAGLSAQYLVDDLTDVETAEDAYLPGGELQIDTQSLELPGIGDCRTQSASVECRLPFMPERVEDISFLPDFPRAYREDGIVSVEMSGTVQLLYRDGSDTLCSGVCRWEVKENLTAAYPPAVLPGSAEEAAVVTGADGALLRTSIPLHISESGSRPIPMVTALEYPENVEPDPHRPSLILRRTSGDSLWNLAKDCGSTMDAIRRANGLQEDPPAGKLLLIPVC